MKDPIQATSNSSRLRHAIVDCVLVGIHVGTSVAVFLGIMRGILLETVEQVISLIQHVGSPWRLAALLFLGAILLQVVVHVSMFVADAVTVAVEGFLGDKFFSVQTEA